MPTQRTATLRVLTALALVACSSGSSGPVAPTSTVKCGGGSIQVPEHLYDVVSLAPIDGATISAPGCATGVSDSSGNFTWLADPGVTYKFDLAANGYASEHIEFAFLASGTPSTGLPMDESSAMSLVPGWTSENGIIDVGIFPSGADGGPCSTPDGVTMSVVGHPEFTPVYYTSLRTKGGTSTSTLQVGSLVLGLGEFGPVPPGTYSVQATKTGCTVQPSQTPIMQYTLSTDVKAGAGSTMSLQLQ